MQPLDGSRLKIVRAQEHIDALRHEIRAFLDQHPYGVRTEYHGGSNWTITPVVAVAPPLRLSGLIGDVLTNSRAALDYILWELAKRHFNPPLSSDDDRWVSFPLTIDPADAGYVNKINRLANRKLPTAAIDEIRAVQPHHRGQEPLWRLHRLVNTDKHRTPAVTIGFVKADFYKTVDNVATLLGTTDGTALHATDTAFPPVDPHKVQMHCQATVFVTWGDLAMPREPVDRTLEQIIKTVADLVPRFEPFLL